MVLAAQISWSESTEQALQTLSTGGDKDSLTGVLKTVENTLNVLADSVLHEQPPVRRKKLESLVRNGADVEHIFIFLCNMYLVCLHIIPIRKVILRRKQAITF